jgi:hypothetical protein
VAKPTTITQSELTKIPFIDSKNIGGRVLTTLTFFEEGKWHMWFPTSTKLIPIIGEPIEADYFARSAVKDTDIYLEFLNFMTQHACWADAMQFIDGIRNDIHNLGASLSKLDLFYHSFRDKHIEVRRFVSTELEYIFGVCRSLFDLLQEVVAALWQKTILFDKSIKKRELPKSFGDVVFHGNQLMTIEAIQAKLRVPTELATFYYRHGSFFQMLRQYRDYIIHSGKDFNSIFVTEKGFAVYANVEPFASFGVWNKEHMLPNKLASLRPVIAYIIIETLAACEDFAQMIQKVIQFPSEIAPGFKLFIRGYHNHQLLAMKDVLTNCSWWETSPDNAGSS